MKLGIVALVLSLSAFAGTKVTTQVIAVEDNNDQKSLDVLVSYDGRIYSVNRSKKSVIADLRFAAQSGAEVELDLSTFKVKDKALDRSESIEEIKIKTLFNHELVDEPTVSDKMVAMDGYQPTNLRSIDEAKRVFKSLGQIGSMKSDSQCFNRAYLWSKFMYKKYRIKSSKIIIYYSRKYRRNIKGSKWWFHIAPTVDVKGKRYAMDYKFNKRPMTALEWENFFTFKIPNKNYDCMQITHRSGRDKNYNNKNEWCMINYAPMYYLGPLDTENLEKYGRRKTSFSNSQIAISAKNAYRNWRRVYNKLKD